MSLLLSATTAAAGVTSPATTKTMTVGKPAAFAYYGFASAGTSFVGVGAPFGSVSSNVVGANTLAALFSVVDGILDFELDPPPAIGTQLTIWFTEFSAVKFSAVTDSVNGTGAFNIAGFHAFLTSKNGAATPFDMSIP